MATSEPRTVVKEVKNGKLYSDGTILLTNVRASYPHVLDKYKGDDDNAKAKHSIVVLMPKKKSYRAVREMVQDEIGKILAANRIKNMKAENKFLRDGDLAGREEYEGMWSINASEAKKVHVLDNKRSSKTGKPRVLKPGEDDDRIYAGCWVNVLIRPWFQNNKFGKKVNAGLVVCQFNHDDEPFGQARISEDEASEDFADYAEDADDDEDDDDDDDI
jgi:hypothetical protein